MNEQLINEIIRNSINDILNYKPTEKELIRKKEIDENARKEKEEYEKVRVEFYNNPLHWDNNKRRRYGLPTLRGNINKNRSKHYPVFHATAYFFALIEDTIDDILGDRFKDNNFFGQFVDIKNLSIGDKDLFYCSK